MSENSVVGADSQYRDNTIFNGKTVQADFYSSSIAGNDDSFGVGLNYPNEP